MATKIKYFKIGKKATAFFCPKCQLKVVNKTPGKVIEAAFRGSSKGKVALANGHIVEIDEKEFLEMVAGTKKASVTPTTKDKVEAAESTEVSESDFKKMNKDQLYTYYKDNYEADEDDLATFKAYGKSEMVESLTELEAEDE